MKRCRHNMLLGQCGWCNRRQAPPKALQGDPDYLEWARGGGEGNRNTGWHAAHERELRELPVTAVYGMSTEQRHAVWEGLALRFGRSRSAVWQRWYALHRGEFA